MLPNLGLRSARSIENRIHMELSAIFEHPLKNGGAPRTKSCHEQGVDREPPGESDEARDRTASVSKFRDRGVAADHRHDAAIDMLERQGKQESAGSRVTATRPPCPQSACPNDEICFDPRTIGQQHVVRRCLSHGHVEVQNDAAFPENVCRIVMSRSHECVKSYRRTPLRCAMYIAACGTCRAVSFAKRDLDSDVVHSNNCVLRSACFRSVARRDPRRASNSATGGVVERPYSAWRNESIFVV